MTAEPPTPPSSPADWSEPARRLEEHGMFLERRQDELLAALDDLSRRMDTLIRRVNQLEQRPHGPQQASQQGEKPDSSQAASDSRPDQSDPGHPA